MMTIETLDHSVRTVTDMIERFKCIEKNLHSLLSKEEAECTFNIFRLTLGEQEKKLDKLDFTISDLNYRVNKVLKQSFAQFEDFDNCLSKENADLNVRLERVYVRLNRIEEFLKFSDHNERIHSLEESANERQFNNMVQEIENSYPTLHDRLTSVERQFEGVYDRICKLELAAREGKSTIDEPNHYIEKLHALENFIRENGSSKRHQPYKCPVCNGTGNHHDQSPRLMVRCKTGSGVICCESCEGKGIVWG